MERFDGVVVGAGWFGLGAAKQYLFSHPGDSLAIYESQSSLGGTWAEERLYPDLKTNNLVGTFEFPDFPMDAEAANVQPGQHVPGRIINAYLRAYAQRFGVDRLVHLNTKVTVAEHQENTTDGGWMLTLAVSKPQAGSGEDSPKSKVVFARRLIMATGLTSEPFAPRFRGQDEFGGRVFHGKYWPQNSDTLKTAKAATIGNSKFAWDAVYSYAKAGVDVHWVIRASGQGPCWMAPPHVTPFKIWMEKLAHVRLLTWFSPCVWGESDGYSWPRRFLHGTAIGRFIVDAFWKLMGSDVESLCDLDSHPETAKLKPWMDVMYTSTSFSLLNYDTDFFEYVRSGKVRVHIGEVDHLSSGQVWLTDGTSFESDVFLAHTGWKTAPPLRFLPEGIEKELGIPHHSVDSQDVADVANQAALAEKADAEILGRFPRLRDQPRRMSIYESITDQRGVVASGDDALTPYKGLTSHMLHRFMVPPSERFLRFRDIAFTGMLFNFSTAITAHIQGLWVSAYFSGLLARDPASAIGDAEAMRKLRYETMLHNRFGRWRYPADWGNKSPAFIFDAVAYLDMLQQDLGLGHHRKANRFREMWEPYGPEDFRNVNDEWRGRVGKETGSQY